MGRHSKLTPDQWDEIGRRIVAGESMGSLSKEFRISKSAISGRCSPKADRIRVVANKLLDANKALNSLPEAERPLAVRLADDLKSISLNLTRAAKAGSDTAAQLAEMANGKVKRALREDGKVDQEVLMDIATLTVSSNRAAAPALRLVAASQDRETAPGDPEDQEGLSALSNQDLDDILAIHERAGGN